MTATRLASLAVAVLVTSQSASAQVICEFGRHYVLAAPAVAHASTRHKVLVGAAFTYSLDNANQVTVGADVTYRVSRALALAAGLAYCDPKLGIDPEAMIGANVSWNSALSADSAWTLAVQLGTSYVEIDLPLSLRQKEVTVPGLVAVEHYRGALKLWAGGLVQYSRSWTTTQTIRSATDPGGALGADVRMSAVAAAGAAYNFLWVEDAAGNSGVFDRLVIRLGYAF